MWTLSLQSAGTALTSLAIAVHDLDTADAGLAPFTLRAVRTFLSRFTLFTLFSSIALLAHFSLLSTRADRTLNSLFPRGYFRDLFTLDTKICCDDDSRKRDSQDQ